MTQLSKKERSLFLDVARTIAIVSISCNHAFNRSIGCGVFPDLLDVFNIALNLFTRIGVPIFLMISGALLLKRDYHKTEELKKFYHHNYLSLFITTEIWYFIMYFGKSLSAGSAIRVDTLIKTMLFIDPYTMGSMWYMPMILCLYLLIPIFGCAIKSIPFRYFAIPMGITMGSIYVIPVVNAVAKIVGYSGTMSMALNEGYLFSFYFVYVLMGYYISNGILKRIPSKLLGVLLMAAVMGAALFTKWLNTMSVHYEMNYYNIGVPIASILAFEAIRRIKIQNIHIRNAAAYMSKISFAIYLVHICIMEVFEKIVAKIHPITNAYILFLVLEIVSVGASVVVIQLFSHFRIARRYLFGIKDNG